MLPSLPSWRMIVSTDNLLWVGAQGTNDPWEHLVLRGFFVGVVLMTAVTTLFADIGGVLMTGFWDRVTRHRAVEQFDLDAVDFNRRHELLYSLHEEGRISLDDYLKQVAVYDKPSFSVGDLRLFMLTQTQPVLEMLQLIRELKLQHGLKVVAVSNGGRELTHHAITECELRSFVDFFVCSCFVGRRKPDPALYKMALDMSQVRPEEVICIEEQRLFVRTAKRLGLGAFQHARAAVTRDALASMGLALEPQDER